MRRHFYDLLSEQEIDVETEYYRLKDLLYNEKCIYYPYNNESLMEYIDSTYFRELSFRGTYTDVNEMVKGILPNAIVTNIDDLFLFCEFLLALLLNKSISKKEQAQKQVNTIIANILSILERTNHTLQDIGKGKKIIVEKNKLTTQAAEIVEDEAIAIELIEYNHFSLKGDLAGKRKLLVSIGSYLEPILKSHILQNSGYGKIESDMGFLLNNFHIRHNNKEGAKAQDYIVNIGNDELEKWFDKAYNTALAVIIINDQIELDKELAALKKDYTWR